MPTEVQQIMDEVSEGLSNTYTFIDDILTVAKGTKNDHWVKVRNVLERLDSMTVHLKVERCDFAQREAAELDFHLPQMDIEPLNSKVEGNTDRLKPENLKELCSFLGAVNQMN